MSSSLAFYLRINGLSFTAWNTQHIVGHHIYTNVAGVDPDLPVNFKSDIRRIVDRQVFRLSFTVQINIEISNSDFETNLRMATYLFTAAVRLFVTQVSIPGFYAYFPHVSNTLMPHKRLHIIFVFFSNDSSRMNGAVRVNPIYLYDWIMLIASKLFWIFHRIWIPLYILQAPHFWLTFFLSEFVTGLYLAFNFQVNI